MFSRVLAKLTLAGLLAGLISCGDAEDEQRLLDLFTVAGLDLVEIRFPAGSTENIISIDSFFDYTVEGVQSNMVDTIDVTSEVEWTISAGALSSIDQTGRLSTGSSAEIVTITATVGNLSASQMVTVSEALFDKVVQLNATAVDSAMCQRTTIVPVGRYVNTDLTEEIRRVDNADIGSIEWQIANKEDMSASQRARVETTGTLTELIGYEAGTVLIVARAVSRFSMTTEVSDEFEQDIDNTLDSISACFGDADSIGVCGLASVDVPIDAPTSIIAVGTFQLSGGGTEERNITALAKWGIDNTNTTIALSADGSQLELTGVTQDASSSITLACGEIEQSFTDLELAAGVVLDEAVSCDAANTDCFASTVDINVIEPDLDSLNVQVNNESLTDDVTQTFTSRPVSLEFDVTAIFNRTDNVVVTDDAGLVYTNNTPTLISEVAGTPGLYTVNSAGDVELVLSYQSVSFTVRLTIP